MVDELYAADCTSHDDFRYSIIISKITGFMSMCATSYMICEILSHKEKRQGTYFRLLLGMNFIEFWDSLAYFLGSWCIPEGFWAAGNSATCMFQGFLLQAQIGSIMYNSSLALYYLLSIKFNWSERLIRKNVEPWMHALPLCLAYGTAIAAAGLGLYVSYGNVCYIGGRTSSVFFYTIWQWNSVAFTATSMLIIWLEIRHQENRMIEYAFDEKLPPVRTTSRRFAIQGSLYVLVFYFCHIFDTVGLYTHGNCDYSPNVLFFFTIMKSLANPLEGFLKFLVYMRPRIIQYYYEKQFEALVITDMTQDSTDVTFVHSSEHLMHCSNEDKNDYSGNMKVENKSDVEEETSPGGQPNRHKVDLEAETSPWVQVSSREEEDEGDLEVETSPRGQIKQRDLSKIDVDNVGEGFQNEVGRNENAVYDNVTPSSVHQNRSVFARFSVFSTRFAQPVPLVSQSSHSPLSSGRITRRGTIATLFLPQEEITEEEMRADEIRQTRLFEY